MILPIGDDNSDRTMTPWVNYMLILANVLVFVFAQRLGADTRVTYAFSMVPQEIATGRDVVTSDRAVTDTLTGERYLVPGLRPTPISVYITLLTAMFMHGGFAHILGNMLYLYIFGDNLENRMGHAGYLLFYLLCGVLAGLAHVYATIGLGGDSLVPTLGASGAISGVLGGYILLFPHRRVTVLLFRFFVQAPAYVAVGLWFLLQIVSALGVLGGGAQAGGVAYAAHVGGFVAGLILVRPFAALNPALGDA
jgi:membrane associated rhomboid family serine protease